MEGGTLEIMLGRVDDSLTLKDRRALKLFGRPVAARNFGLAVIGDTIRKWRELNADAPGYAAGVGEDRETPILDFLRELIEQGKIQPFIQFLFEQIPILIKAIVAIFAVV